MEMVESGGGVEESENPSAPDGYDGFPDSRRLNLLYKILDDKLYILGYISTNSGKSNKLFSLINTRFGHLKMR